MDFFLSLLQFAVVIFAVWLGWKVLKSTVRVVFYTLFPPRADILIEGDYRTSLEQNLANGGMVLKVVGRDDKIYTLTMMPDHQVPLTPKYWEDAMGGLRKVVAQAEPFPSYSLPGYEVEIFFPRHMYISDITFSVYEAQVSYQVIYKRLPTLLPQMGYKRVISRGYY